MDPVFAAPERSTFSGLIGILGTSELKRLYLGIFCHGTSLAGARRAEQAIFRNDQKVEMKGLLDL